MVQVLDIATGEIMQFADRTPLEVRNSWDQITQQIKALERAKDKLKPKVAELIETGRADFGDCEFRQTVVQRMTYNKAIMRRVLDADTYDLFLVPDKTAIDGYLKENLEHLGDVSTQLRESMLPVGEPYTTIRLEKKQP